MVNWSAAVIEDGLLVREKLNYYAVLSEQNDEVVKPVELAA